MCQTILADAVGLEDCAKAGGLDAADTLLARLAEEQFGNEGNCRFLDFRDRDHGMPRVAA